MISFFPPPESFVVGGGSKNKSHFGSWKNNTREQNKSSGQGHGSSWVRWASGERKFDGAKPKKKKNFSGYVELADGGTRPFFKGGSKILAYFVFMFIRRYIRLGDELDCKGVACRDLPRENGPFPLMDR